MLALEFEDVFFSYDGTRQALDGVSLGVQPGEFVSVVGRNGSGKSTLARLAIGLLAPGSGRLRVFGTQTSDFERASELRSIVGMVFQNPDEQIVAGVVEDDVAFGPENLGIPPAQIRDRVEEALERAGLADLGKRAVDTLSGGQKQRVAIAGALALEPRVLVLDEASSMLDPCGRAELQALCKELNRDGIAVVQITHFMEEAAASQRVIVMNGGRVAFQGPPGEVLSRTAELRACGLKAPFAARLSNALRDRGVQVGPHVEEGALVEELKGLLAASRTDEPALAGAPAPDAPDVSAGATTPEHEGAAIEFQDVWFAYDAPPSRKRGHRAKAPQDTDDAHEDGRWALRGLSFSLGAGELLGVAGRTGSGKSTLVQLCNGLLRAARGRVLACGRPIDSAEGAARARRGVGVAFQYPEHQLFAASVFDDVAFGPRNLGLDEAEVESRVSEALASVGLDAFEVRDSSPFALSGGEQRRVAIAGVLAMQPAVLVLDEPFAGLDPAGCRDFERLVAGLRQAGGRSIVIVSHDMDALGRLCDRVLVLDGGRMQAIGAPTQVFADGPMLRAAGLEQPAALRVAGKLGLNLPDRGHVPTADELADVLADALMRASAGL